MKTTITLEKGIAFFEDGTEVSGLPLAMIKHAPLMLKILVWIRGRNINCKDAFDTTLHVAVDEAINKVIGD